MTEQGRVTGIEEMPEWQRLARVRAFSVSVEVFTANADELLRLIDEAHVPEVAVRLWAVENRFLLDQFHREIARRLHNVVSSAFALVDHARSFHQYYKKDGEFADYEEQVKVQFAQCPVSQFVQGLRNYCIHVRAPNIGSRVSWELTDESTGTGKMQHVVYLPTDQFVGSDAMNAQAKSYLESVGAEVDVRDAVNEYRARVTDFYDWVFERLGEIHAKDHAAVAERQAAERANMSWVARKSLEQGLLEAQKDFFRPELLFAPLMSSEDYHRIVSEEDELLRASKFIEKVEENFSISLTDLRERITGLFEQAADETTAP